MAREKVLRKVKLSDIHVDTFVRKSLIPELVKKYTDLMLAGVKFPPLLVSGSMRLVDGRHRLEAYTNCQESEVEAEIVDPKDEAEFIGMAFKANSTKGPAQPTEEDIKHTISLLLDQKVVSSVAIAEVLGEREEYVRPMIKDVKSKAKRAKMMKAVNAVADGDMKPVEAAEEFGVKIEDLRQAITGRRRKEKKGPNAAQLLLAGSDRSYLISLGHGLNKLMDAYNASDLSPAQMTAVYDQQKAFLKKVERRLEDWHSRYMSKVG